MRLSPVNITSLVHSWCSELEARAMAARLTLEPAFYRGTWSPKIYAKSHGRPHAYKSAYFEIIHTMS